MPAGTWNTVIEQGSDWSRSLLWTDSNATPINLSGYSARMQIRLDREPATPLIMELNSTPATGKGTITLGGAAGTIVLALTAALTAAMDFTGAQTGTVTEASETVEGQLGVYDLELVSGGGLVTRLVSGVVCFSPEVAR